MAVDSQYRAPKLNRRVLIRREVDRPVVSIDRYGGVAPAPDEYGVPVWCARRDIRTRQAGEDGVVVDRLRVVFTVRYASTLADRTDMTVLDGGTEFYVDGVPLERGRRGASASHLELHCDSRR